MPATQSLVRSIALLLALAACVPQATAPPPPPAASPPPVPIAAPVAVDWRDGPLDPGNWRWHRDDRGAVALYGPAGADAIFVVRCDRAERKISLTVPGTVTAGDNLVVTTSDGDRSLTAADAGGTPPYAGAALRADDALLDRMAFSRGRIRVRLGAARAIVLPAWPEYGRAIEECRG